MTPVLRIVDGKERRDLDASDLPLGIGVSEDGSSVLEPTPGIVPVAWIGTTGDRFYLHPVKEAERVLLNDAPLVRSTWLKPGDAIQIGKETVSIGLESGVVVLSRLRSTDVLRPEPPKDLAPPPDPPPERAQEPPQKPAPDSEQIESAAAPSNSAGDRPTADASEPRDEPARPLPGRPTTQESDDVPTTSPNERPRPTGTDKQAEEFGRLRSGKKRIWMRLSIAAAFLVVVLGVAFVLVAVPLEIIVSPAPDSLKVSGTLPPVKIRDRYLVVPGNYELVATKLGYHPLRETLAIDAGSDSLRTFEMRKLPGRLSISTDPLKGAAVRIGSEIVGETPVTDLSLDAGRYELSITADRYLPLIHDIDIEGMGVQQSVELALEPGWGTLRVVSRPEGADVFLDAEPVGTTPLETEPMGGLHQLVLRMDGWKDAQEDVLIRPGEETLLPTIVLARMDGTLEVTSEPDGARVTIDGEYQGRTPLSATLTTAEDHALGLSLNGYASTSRTVQVESTRTTSVHVPLEVEYGRVFVLSRPPDATLLVDGRELEGPASQALLLQTVPHTLELTRDGFESVTQMVTPTAGIPKRLDIALNRVHAAPATHTTESTTEEQQTLILVPINDAVTVELGTSRRGQYARSNERLYTVELTRPFYIGAKEVTNDEFRRFRSAHDSGNVNGIDISEPDQPVTSVTWDDAAAYLNWLSEREGLPPAYREENGRMVAVQPITTGYRLPTEAEWAFVARFEAGRRTTPKRFPWGDEPPASQGSGNYADITAASFLPAIMEDYDDGFWAAAPVGSFPPDTLGLFDIGGNVSEWCHDYYEVRAGNPSAALRDPTGPDQGSSHVVRGASWRQSSYTELRLSYRDSVGTSRDDLGFRIARYAEEPSP